MKSKSLKLQIATTFIVLLALSMFMLSCVWVMLTQKALIKNEIVLLQGYADFLGESEDLQDGENLCYRIIPGRTGIDALEAQNCSVRERKLETIEKWKEGGGKSIEYSGTQWAVLIFSHKNIIVTKPVFEKNDHLRGTIVIETALEPLYRKIRDDWKIVIYYLLVNAIVFSSIGLLRMFKLVLKPIDRLLDISEKSSPQGELLFYPGDANNEFSKLSHGLNLMVSRIREDNRQLSATVAALETANKELKRNENEMIRTEKMASVGRLSAGLAHEIGNPLGIVQGYVDMLGGANLTDKEKVQFSERANSELRRIDSLIRQLLDISRKVEKEHTTVHVQELIQKVLDFFSVQQKNRTIDISTDFKAMDDRAAVHEDQLRQVLLNCLMNAKDALQENDERLPGKIRVVCENTVVGGEEMVQITINDNGPGVDSEHINNIFDPFFTTKETGKGTGLGLYVSYTIMENLGGSIRLNNIDPAGAEVVIELPCKNTINTL